MCLRPGTGHSGGQEGGQPEPGSSGPAPGDKGDPASENGTRSTPSGKWENDARHKVAENGSINPPFQIRFKGGFKTRDENVSTIK